MTNKTYKILQLKEEFKSFRFFFANNDIWIDTKLSAAWNEIPFSATGICEYHSNGYISLMCDINAHHKDIRNILNYLRENE